MGGRDAFITPRGDAGMGDASSLNVDAYVPPGTDGGPRADAYVAPGMDGGPVGCTSAAECSDGLACNGVERCEGSRCVAGTPMVCDDGLSCTTDTCTEPGTCGYVSTCPAGQTCGAGGCTSACPETPCRLVSPQCGCASGQGCYLNGAMRMCMIAGGGAEGAACTASVDCQAGLECINVASSGTAATLCLRHCTTDANCTGGGSAGSICLLTLNDGMGGDIPGVTLCTRACDPVNQTGCPTAATCSIYQESAGAMRYLTHCSAPFGAGRAGAFCADDSGCARGFACLANTCYHWCRVATGSGCSGLERCTSLAPAAIVGGVEYGVCT